MKKINILFQMHIIKTVIVLIIVSIIFIFINPANKSDREIGKLDYLEGTIKKLIIHPSGCDISSPRCSGLDRRYVVIQIDGYKDTIRPLLRSVNVKEGMKVPIKRYSFSDGSESLGIDEIAILEQQ